MNFGRKVSQMDEIINYRDLDESEKEQCLDELLKTSFSCPCSNVKAIKVEMDKTQEGSLPQFVFVRRDKKVIGYMFLIAEKENTSKIFPWWAVENSDELPVETDLRLLQYGVSLCNQAGCLKLANRLEMQMGNHRNGIGRRPPEFSL